MYIIPVEFKLYKEFEWEDQSTSDFTLGSQIILQVSISLIHNDVKKMAALFGGTLIFSSTGAYGEKFFDRL